MSDCTARRAATPHCARCSIAPGERYCRVEKGKGPADCPSLHYKKLAEQALLSTSEEEREFARQASLQEKAAYSDDLKPVKPRIVEIVEFAHRMGYTKLGLIFCIGCIQEAGIVQQIFETNGFSVVSICCKVGKMPKSALGVTQEQYLRCANSFETACNPKLQALIANEEGVDFSVLMNLCVGHDSLVFKHLDGPATVLAVKDRLLMHNPMAAIYGYSSYHHYLKQPLV